MSGSQGKKGLNDTNQSKWEPTYFKMVSEHFAFHYYISDHVLFSKPATIVPYIIGCTDKQNIHESV